MVLPIVEKNTIIREAKACIVEEGRDPEECIVEAARNHGLNRQQVQEVADEIMNDAEE